MPKSKKPKTDKPANPKADDAPKTKRGGSRGKAYGVIVGNSRGGVTNVDEFSDKDAAIDYAEKTVQEMHRAEVIHFGVDDIGTVVHTIWRR